ncbi:unnamed protein product [Rotaria socialis]|uniref:Uncharacterized protein n=1 Tax=Rotaria socialis TaxID=392032 RepID=A0A821X5I2_9BILA|nr:unnamed protein product [Rotaria socialis]
MRLVDSQSCDAAVCTHVERSCMKKYSLIEDKREFNTVYRYYTYVAVLVRSTIVPYYAEYYDSKYNLTLKMCWPWTTTWDPVNFVVDKNSIAAEHLSHEIAIDFVHELNENPSDNDNFKQF